MKVAKQAATRDQAQVQGLPAHVIPHPEDSSGAPARPVQQRGVLASTGGGRRRV